MNMHFIMNTFKDLEEDMSCALGIPAAGGLWFAKFKPILDYYPVQIVCVQTRIKRRTVIVCNVVEVLMLCSSQTVGGLECDELLVYSSTIYLSFEGMPGAQECV